MTAASRQQGRFRGRNALPDNPIGISSSLRPCRRQPFNLERHDSCFVSAGIGTQRPLPQSNGHRVPSCTVVIDTVDRFLKLQKA